VALVRIGESKQMQGTVWEVREGETMATLRIQFGESIIESDIPKALLDDLGIKVGDPVTATFEVTPVDIIR
jgi:molybdopterin-binding protein